MSSKLIVCLLTLLLKWGDVTMGGARGLVPCPNARSARVS